MRPLWKDILAAAWLGILIPGIVLHAAVFAARQEPRPVAEETVPEPIGEIRLGREGEQVLLTLEDYLTGVVLGEMPASFHPEALKAQTVAAGTYARKALSTGGSHGDGSLCGESTCCQAYLSPEDYLLAGGTEESVEKVRQAVNAAAAYVLMFEEELIEAVYFSCSGGRTEAAVAVWGADFPYLQSVESPGEEAARYHTDSLLIPQAEFLKLLNLPESSELSLGEPTYTEGGGVDTLEISGTTFTGTELRSLLNLRSTAFTLEPTGDYIRIATRGYGHRVGMSQYGANAMAQTGHTWQAILQYYYPGTTIVPMSDQLRTLAPPTGGTVTRAA